MSEEICWFLFVLKDEVEEVLFRVVSCCNRKTLWLFFLLHFATSSAFTCSKGVKCCYCRRLHVAPVLKSRGRRKWPTPDLHPREFWEQQTNPPPNSGCVSPSWLVVRRSLTSPLCDSTSSCSLNTFLGIRAAPPGASPPRKTLDL